MTIGEPVPGMLWDDVRGWYTPPQPIAPTPAAPDLRALLVKAAKALEPFEVQAGRLSVELPDRTGITVELGNLRHARAVAAEIRAALGEG